MTRVVVDANAIAHGAWRLDSAAWTVLLRRAADGLVKVVVPETVVREVVGRFRPALAEEAHSLDNSLRKLNRMIGDFTLPEELDIDHLCVEYDRLLRATLEDHGVTVAMLPDIDPYELADAAIARTKPFDAKGNGFRDALFWRVVLQLLSLDPSEMVVVVSDDKTAFQDPAGPGLHPDLIAQATAAAGQEIDITLVSSVSAALKSLGVDDPKLAAVALEAVASHSEDLRLHAAEALTGTAIGTAGYPDLSAVISSAEVHNVGFVHIAGAAGDGAPFLVDVVVEADVAIELRYEDATPTGTEVAAALTLKGSAVYTGESFERFSITAPSIGDIPEALRQLQEDDRLPSVWPGASWQVTIDPKVLDLYRGFKVPTIDPKVLDLYRGFKVPTIDPKVFDLYRGFKVPTIDPKVFDPVLRWLRASGGHPRQGDAKDAGAPGGPQDPDPADDPPDETGDDKSSPEDD